MGNKKIYIGTIVSPGLNRFLHIDSGFLVVENGKITQKGSQNELEKLKEKFLKNEGNECEVVTLKKDQFLLPGFVDCHTHAPQFPNLGLGLDRPLLEWLDKYTFPLEKKYEDVSFAASVYDQVVRRLLDNGTTTACYFGSLHLNGTLELVRSAIKYRQRALVGKVSMNLKNDAGYYNETEKEIRDTEAFVQKVLGYKSDLVEPMITPRFALSCGNDLMKALAKISDQYGCKIQSHISENLKEIQAVLDMNPDCQSYAEVYDKCGLLNNRCIMAHGVHLTDAEIILMASKGVSVAHCPASNTRLASGLCPVRKLLDSHIKVGLGTDISGGDNPSILDAMRRAMDVSTHLQLLGGKLAPVDWKDAIYLATLGGATALNLDDKVGSFEVDKDFDALLVDVYAKDSPINHYDHSVDSSAEDYAASLVQRFVYLGDDRNIVKVYVKGDSVKDNSHAPECTLKHSYFDKVSQ